jgi:hypothetical protein
MRMVLGAVALGVIFSSAVAVAQSTKDALPVGATEFVCGWGNEARPGHGELFKIENGSLMTEQTGDIWRILQNNQFGFVATQSESEFVPKLNKKIVAFWSIAIDRTTGKAVQADGRTDLPGNIGTINQGICTEPLSPQP